MKKRLLSAGIFTLLVLIGLVLFNSTSYKVKGLLEDRSESFEEENEERPKVSMSEAELAVNKRRVDRYLKTERSLKSASEVSTYANGAIQGTWEQYRFLTYNGSPYGFRIIGSVYDQENDMLYSISDAGHLWKIYREEGNESNTQWEVMNHKEDFNTYIDGLNKEDGSFRMVRCSDNRMLYSDNEGRDWVAASGVQPIAKSYEGAVVKTDTGNKVFVLLKTSSTNQQVFVSNDNGESYTPLSTKFSPSSYYVKLFKVHNSESVFLAAFRYSDSKVSIYEHTVDGSGFELVNTSSSTFISLDNVFGTYYDGNFHFYIATGYTNIYYSGNKGSSWSLKTISHNSGDGNTNARDVHPTKPNVIFRGYLDAYVSTNYGATFSNFGHRLGWDVHHMKFYQRSDSSFFFFLGKDFGCYISDNAELWSSYVSLNNNSPAQMCYDADHGQNYYSSFTANQDRGTVGFVNSENQGRTYDVRTTDGLRVTLANNDASVWTWMYFGTIFHKSNFAATSSGLTPYEWTGNWWAAPMVASPYQHEDAVYVAAGPKLTKFTFNSANNSIIETSHYYNFQAKTGLPISGFAYSERNPYKWYVSVENGKFFYSIDGGNSFEQSSYTGTMPKANDQFYNYNKNQHVIKASRIVEDRVYYAGVGNVFLISDDGGKSFTKHTKGLDVYRIRDFDFSPDEKFIFAACGNGGIWVYSMDDDTWYEMNDAPVPNVDFTDVEFIVKKNAVKFATYGSGILTLNIDGKYQDIIYPDSLTAVITNEGFVSLQWNDYSDNEEGFIIERAANGKFEQIASVAANTTSYVDNNELAKGNFQYRVKAFNSSGESFYSNYAFIKKEEESVIPKSGWTLVSVNSEANGYSALNAFDDDIATIWHTDWKTTPIPSHPHTLIIDMKEVSNIQGFSYLPRQDNNLNGTIKGYEFYVSTDNISWTKVAEGSWGVNSDKKVVEFSAGYDARYIKLVALSEVNGSAFASCAEISVFTHLPDPSAPNVPQFVQGGRLSDTQIELIWMDKSSDEDGFIIEQLIKGSFSRIYTSGKDVTSYILSNATVNESYTFRVSAFNNIGNSDYSEYLVIPAVGTTPSSVQELPADNFKVYPNPFSNQITITIDESDSYNKYQILNLSGKIVESGFIQERTLSKTIDLQELRAGTYVLVLTGESKFVSKTIIKK